METKNPLVRVYTFYLDGFRSMTVGRTLWFLILVKLFVMFAILKLFFLPSFLNKFESDTEKGNYVREQLIERTE